MFLLGILLTLWLSVVLYGLSHDARRWWFDLRARRAARRAEREQKALDDLRQSFRSMCH